VTTPRKKLEERSRAVARRITEALPTGAGFALFVFDFGAKGNLAYVSNAKRDDMIAAVKEWLAKQEAGVFTDPEAQA
jgi:hypothetical protein